MKSQEPNEQLRKLIMILECQQKTIDVLIQYSKEICGQALDDQHPKRPTMSVVKKKD